jgi:hypothetical protein
VGDDEDRESASAELVEQVEHRRRVLAVEVAGRFVAQQQAR